MALTINTNIKNDADGYLLDAKNVKGTYVVVPTTADRDALYTSTLIAGSRCYVSSEGKTYLWNGSSWEISPETDVINNTTSTATNKPLSANMGKELQNQIDNLKARGRFLSLWSCVAGLAQSTPTVNPYVYKTGDYFIIDTVKNGGYNHSVSFSGTDLVGEQFNVSFTIDGLEDSPNAFTTITDIIEGLTLKEYQVPNLLEATGTIIVEDETKQVSAIAKGEYGGIVLLNDNNEQIGQQIDDDGEEHHFAISDTVANYTTNYKPNGSTYNKDTPSTTVETENVSPGDIYYYDSKTWLLQINTQKELAFVNIAGSPFDNSSLAEALNGKVDKVTGKGLSTNDFTTAEKGKLATIESGAKAPVESISFPPLNKPPTDSAVIGYVASQISGIKSCVYNTYQTLPPFIGLINGESNTQYIKGQSFDFKDSAIPAMCVKSVESTQVTYDVNTPAATIASDLLAGNLQIGYYKFMPIGSSSGGAFDDTVKFSTEFKTYYNVGKITNASGTNPVTVANAGDTLRTMLNNMFVMDEVQPTITSDPAITSLSFSSSESDELGTEITSVSYSLATSEGAYTYQPNPTGVSWSKYNFTGGCVSTDKTAKNGTLTLSSTYVVGESSDVTFTCEGTHSDGGIAKTNLGNNSNPIVQISAGTKTRNGSFSKPAVAYPYYTSTASSSVPSTGTKGARSLESTSGATISYEQGKYLWIFSVNNNANKKIQIYSELTKSWSDMLGGTEAPSSVTFTMANGKTRTYYAYRTTNISQSSGSALIRLN